MNLETLNTYKEKFEEFISSEKNNETVYERYDSFYKWLLNTIEEEEDKQLLNRLQAIRFETIHNLINWFEKKNLKAVGFSKEWDKTLIGRIGSWAKEYQSLESKLNIPQKLAIKTHYIFKDLNDCRDVATVSYGWSIIEREAWPRATEIQIQMFSTTSEQTTSESNDIQRTVKRPRASKGFIDDDGSKYWHTGAKEFMTYDECTQKGLGHHLLVYPIGHSLQNLSIGFDEPNSDLVKKVENEEVEKWVEEVIS